MVVMKDKSQRMILILLGSGFVVISLILSPDLVAKYFSPDGILGKETLERIYLMHLSLIFWGVFFCIVGIFKKYLLGLIESQYLWINRVLSYIFLGGLLVLFFFYLFVVLNRMSYPSFCGDWVEKTLFVEAVRIMNGNFVYVNPESAPIPTLYGFVYKTLGALLMKIFGVQTIILKAISFFASLATGVMIYLVVYKETRKTFVGLISSLFYFGLYRIIAFWYDTGKTDSLYLLLSLVGIWIIQDSLRHRNVFLSAFVLALAFFTNQTAIFAMAAVLVYLIIKDRKQAVVFVLPLTLFTGLGLILLTIFTDRWYWFWTIVWPSSLPFKLMDGVKGLVYFSAPLFVVVISTIVFVCFSLKQKTISSNMTILWLIATAFAFAFSTISYSKAGANYNVFMPAAIFLSILFGFSYHWVTKHIESKRKYFLLSLYRFALILQLVVMFYNPTAIYPFTKEDIENLERLQNYVSSSEGEIYLPNNQDIGALVGKETYDDEPALADYLLAGYSFPERLKRKMLNADFAEVIIPSGYEPFSSLWYGKYSYPEEFRDAFFKNYEKTEEKWGMIFYKHKDKFMKEK